MSISNNPPPIPPRRDLGQKNSRSTQKQDSFKAELAKAVYAYAERVEGSTSQSSTPQSDGVQSESSVKHAKIPGPTAESENVKKKDSMKKRFLKAILRRDFPGAYREISQKVSLERFQQWLAKTLPDIDSSFNFDPDFRSFVGAEAASKATSSEEEKPIQIPPEYSKRAAGILAQVQDSYTNGRLNSTYKLLKPQIDDLQKDMKGKSNTKELKNFLNELKKELKKGEPSAETIKNIALKPKNKEVVDKVYPVFIFSVEPGKFKEDFGKAVGFMCDVIDENFLGEEGLFRTGGSVEKRGEVLSRALGDETKESIFENFKSDGEYTKNIKSLVAQVEQMEQAGQLTDVDLENMKPAFQRIHETLKRIIDHRDGSGENINKINADNIHIAAPNICTYLNRVLELEGDQKYKVTSVDDAEALLKAFINKNS